MSKVFDLAVNGTAHRGSRRFVLGLLLAKGAMLGLSASLAKVGGELGLEPLALTAWSVGLASLFLIGLARLRGRLPRINRYTVEYFTVSAGLTVAAATLISYAAAPKVGASLVSLTTAFPPLFTYVGAILFSIEAFHWKRALGVLTALSGAALLAALEFSSPDGEALWVGLAFLAPVLLGVGNIYRTLRWPEGETPESLAPGMVAAGAVMLFSAAAIPGFNVAVPEPSPRVLGLIAGQAVIFASQFLFLFALQKHGGPVPLSLTGTVAAIFGVPLAVFLLGEPPPRGLLPGGFAIALGVGLLTIHRAEGPA